MLMFYHFADVDMLGGGHNDYQPKVDDLHFYKPFLNLLKSTQICLKTLDLVTENYKSSSTSMLGI